MKSSSIYVYTKEPNDYPQPTKFLNQINFEHEHFVKRFASESVIIIDDFSWNPSPEQRNHLARLINFTLRHKKISLILILHSLYNSRIYTEIKNCTNIFLTYSFNAKRVFTQLGKEYSHFYQFFFCV